MPEINETAQPVAMNEGTAIVFEAHVEVVEHSGDKFNVTSEDAAVEALGFVFGISMQDARSVVDAVEAEHGAWLVPVSEEVHQEIQHQMETAGGGTGVWNDDFSGYHVTIEF